jgi:hypothetical protein
MNRKSHTFGVWEVHGQSADRLICLVRAAVLSRWHLILFLRGGMLCPHVVEGGSG